MDFNRVNAQLQWYINDELAKFKLNKNKIDRREIKKIDWDMGHQCTSSSNKNKCEPNVQMNEMIPMNTMHQSFGYGHFVDNSDDNSPSDATENPVLPATNFGKQPTSSTRIYAHRDPRQQKNLKKKTEIMSRKETTNEQFPLLAQSAENHSTPTTSSVDRPGGSVPQSCKFCQNEEHDSVRCPTYYAPTAREKRIVELNLWVHLLLSRSKWTSILSAQQKMPGRSITMTAEAKISNEELTKEMKNLTEKHYWLVSMNTELTSHIAVMKERVVSIGLTPAETSTMTKVSSTDGDERTMLMEKIDALREHNHAMIPEINALEKEYVSGGSSKGKEGKSMKVEGEKKEKEVAARKDGMKNDDKKDEKKNEEIGEKHQETIEEKNNNQEEENNNEKKEEKKVCKMLRTSFCSLL
ncbi:hypothetical protein PRIPAC_70625 [Pristionchus pacificus]|uniref:Uncharacterized protein n=1 Tax=Pristionchus pacificus TaxID=54126 RepID=A0A2A6C0Q7_PRIPA|nr:hypothetical protein PRIPAC_70625 [Pristionchus pacificus]|eukprot:PDM71730.1 hypothetical protein PRIPAC_38137 [Pristionchus pacificus]